MTDHGTNRLDARDSATEAENRRILRQWWELEKESSTKTEAARIIGVSLVKLSRIIRRYEAEGDAGLRSRRANSGRQPHYLPTAEELQCVREIYVRLDESRARGRGLGSSKVAAYRLAAKGDDPRISEAFRRVVLNPKRKSKRLPPSWTRLLDTSAGVLDAHRDKRSTMAAYVSTPRGRTYINADGEEVPMRCGSIFEADDGTLNFYAWVDWPFGGDRCSERYGAKLGRWQLLPVIDVHSEMCVAFDVVSRSSSSYRGEDVRALIGRTMLEEGCPELWRLERGSWESKTVRDPLAAAGVPVFNAWHSKQKNAVERFFDRLWTPASLIPGHVGRDRARYQQTTNLAMACQDGRRDPRDFFLSIEEALKKVIKSIEFVNSEPIESHSGWGTWVPQKRWESQVGERPLPAMEECLAAFFAREQRVKKVRRGVVGWDVEGPECKFPVYFQHEDFWEFEGCSVKAYFDPYADPCTGTIALDDKEWRGYKRGHVIAADVRAMDLAPQAVLADDWNDDDRAEQIKIRKRISKAVRTEMWNWRGGRGREIRDGAGGMSRAEVAASRGDGEPAKGRDRDGAAPRIKRDVNAQTKAPERPAARMPASMVRLMED